MKKYIVLFLVLLFVNTAKSQMTYFNYLDYTSEWRYYSSGWNGWCCIDTDYSTTYFDGDTTLNGQQYYKRYTVNIHNGSSPVRGGVSFVREDSVGHFLTYSPASGTETVFFDNQQMANAQVGDPFPYPGATCNVMDIDTVAFDFKQLKHLYGVNTQLYTGSMEGVGFISLACVMSVESGGGLSCYSKQGSSIQFGSISCSSPLFPTPIKTSLTTSLNNQMSDKDIMVFPNPVSSVLLISDNQNQLQNATVKIKNMMGQIILNKTFSKEINISGLSSGVYFLTIEDKNSKKTIKILKE